jgi:diacylglycerol kinase family enzyme
MVSKPPLANGARYSTAAERVAVVVNGRARQVTEELVETLDQIVQSGDLFVSRNLEEGKEIARVIVERGYPTVLTGGGDGTFVQMLSWIVGVALENERPIPRFGLLKLGTGNAMAWVLGAQHGRHGKGAVADLARLRSEGGSRVLRMIAIDDMLTPFGGLGADAIALDHHRTARQFFERTPLLRRFASGPVTYSASLLGLSVPRFLLSPMPRFRVINTGEPAVRLGQDGRRVGAEISAGEVLYEGPAYILAFGTIPYWGFGARIFPYADERPDRFDLRIASFNALTAVANVRSIWRGTYHSDQLHDFLVESIRVECDQPTPLELGGDLIGMRSSIDASLSKLPIRLVDYYSPPPV